MYVMQSWSRNEQEHYHFQNSHEGESMVKWFIAHVPITEYHGCKIFNLALDSIFFTYFIYYCVMYIFKSHIKIWINSINIWKFKNTNLTFVTMFEALNNLDKNSPNWIIITFYMIRDHHLYSCKNKL